MIDEIMEFRVVIFSADYRESPLHADLWEIKKTREVKFARSEMWVPKHPFVGFMGFKCFKLSSNIDLKPEFHSFIEFFYIGKFESNFLKTKRFRRTHLTHAREALKKPRGVNPRELKPRKAGIPCI